MVAQEGGGFDAMPKIGQDLMLKVQQLVLDLSSSSDVGDVVTIKEDNACLKLTQTRRMEFYERAKESFVIIQTNERIPYGNIIISKGVVGPDGKDLKPTCTL